MSVHHSKEITSYAQPDSSLCRPETEDIIAAIYAFTETPNTLRHTCRFSVRCWDHAVKRSVNDSSGLRVNGRSTLGPYRILLPCPYAQPIVSYVKPITGRGGEEGGAPALSWVSLPVSATSFAGASKATWFPLQLSIVALGKRVISLGDFLGEEDDDGGCALVLPQEDNRGGTPLQTITVAHLDHLQRIQDGFLAGRASLRSASFRNLPFLKQVGGGWMSECRKLTTVYIGGGGDGLGNLTSVGESWLQGCCSLTSFTLKGLPNLANIGQNFLEGCSALRDASFVDLPRLSKVGTRWLCNCTTLVTLHFEKIPSLSAFNVGVQDTEGRGFLEDSNHKNILVTFGGGRNGEEQEEFVRMVKELTSLKRSCPVQ